MHRRYRVSGKVQGVSYRANTCKVAQKLNVQGWVCNLSNGDVLLQTQGESSAVEQLESWLWRGPSWAKVNNVEVTILDDMTGLEYDGFIIKRDQA